jgi:hypothetical protein
MVGPSQQCGNAIVTRERPARDPPRITGTTQSDRPDGIPPRHGRTDAACAGGRAGFAPPRAEGRRVAERMPERRPFAPLTPPGPTRKSPVQLNTSGMKSRAHGGPCRRASAGSSSRWMPRTPHAVGRLASAPRHDGASLPPAADAGDSPRGIAPTPGRACRGDLGPPTDVNLKTLHECRRRVVASVGVMPRGDRSHAPVGSADLVDGGSCLGALRGRRADES